MHPSTSILVPENNAFDANFETKDFQLAGNDVARCGIKGDDILKLAGHPAADQRGITASTDVA